MLTRRMAMCSAVVVLLAVPVLAQQDPNAPAPGAIAHHCRVQITRIAGRTVHQMRVRANHCIGRINTLLKEGEDAMAEEVAADCIRFINEIAERRSNRIAEIAGRCIDRLTELDAPPQLIEMIQQIAETRTEMIATRRAAEVQRVEEALAG